MGWVVLAGSHRGGRWRLRPVTWLVAQAVQTVHGCAPDRVSHRTPYRQLSRYHRPAEDMLRKDDVTFETPPELLRTCD